MRHRCENSAVLNSLRSYALASLFFATEVFAQTESVSPILLHTEGCEVDDREVLRILSIELKSQALPEVYTARVACEDDMAKVTLDRQGVEAGSRQTPLGAAGPRGRARLLALVLSELVLAAPPAEPKAPKEPPKPPPSTPPPPPVARPESYPFVASLSATGRAETNDRLAALGIRIAALFPVWKLSLSPEFGADHGVRTASLGRVSFDTFGIGTSLLIPFTGEHVMFGVGPLVRGGLARVHGDPHDATVSVGRSGTSPWIDAGLLAAFHYFPFGPVGLTLRAEAAGHVLGVDARVEQLPEVSMRGLYLAGALGVALRVR